ncbi:hypothetical protein [Nostocoides australiense]
MIDKSGRGASYFAQIENFYGCSLDELLSRLKPLKAEADFSKRRTELADFLKLGEFFELKARQWDLIPVGSLPAQSLFYWNSGGDVNQIGTAAFQKDPSSSYKLGGVEVERIDPFRAVALLGGSWSQMDAGELKNLLMYTEGAILVDPLSDFGVSSAVDFQLALQDVGHNYLNPIPGMMALLGGLTVGATYPLRERPEDFVRLLLVLQEFRPLFESETVSIIPAPDLTRIYFGFDSDVRDDIQWRIHELPDRRSIHPTERKLLSWVLLRRAKAQVALLAEYGLTTGFFCAGSLDRVAADALVEQMIKVGSINPRFVLPALGGESHRLQELLRIQLPGVGRIKTTDMAILRTDERIGDLRGTMRAALDASSGEPDVDTARRLCSEEVSGALRALGASRIGARLRDAAAGDIAGLAMGALAGWSIDGWRGSLAGAAAGAAWETVKGRPTRGTWALHHHYTELSTLQPAQ